MPTFSLPPMVSLLPGTSPQASPRGDVNAGLALIGAQLGADTNVGAVNYVADSAAAWQGANARRWLPPPIQLGFPYRSFRSWLLGQRVLWDLAHNPLLPSNAVRRAREVAQQTAPALEHEIISVTQDSRFDVRAREALVAGAAIGLAGLGLGLAIGLAAGAGFGPIGAVCGAAIGFIAGCVVAILPTAQWDLRGRWRSVMESFTPIERYFTVASFRDICNRGRAQLDPPKGPLAPWRMADGSFYTDWGGADASALFCWQLMMEFDCFPASSSPAEPGRWSPVAAFAMGHLAAEPNDDAPLRDARNFQQLMDGHGSQWLRPIAERARDMRCGEIRAAILARGLEDSNVAPYTTDVEAAARRQSAVVAPPAGGR